MVLVPVQLGGGLGGGAALPAVGGGPWLRAQSDQGEGAESAKVSKNLWLEVNLFIFHLIKERTAHCLCVRTKFFNVYNRNHYSSPPHSKPAQKVAKTCILLT